MSADGRHGLTVIAFIGGVFSPYYALARAIGRGDPENHVAVNVLLSGRPRRWAMTERGRASLFRDTDSLAIGRSTMRWDGDGLHIAIDETTAPIPSRLIGRVTVRPRGISSWAFHLDRAGRHRWHPLSPLCDIAVDFTHPDIAWQGTGYFDTNNGDEPLEASLRAWDWTRFDLGREARISYDVVEKDGTERPLSVTVTEGNMSTAHPLPYRTLPRTRWRIPRRVPCDAGADATISATMVDAPFYARTAVRSTVEGRLVDGVGESLILGRVTNPLVRLMLPFKTVRTII